MKSSINLTAIAAGISEDRASREALYQFQLKFDADTSKLYNELANLKVEYQSKLDIEYKSASPEIKSKISNFIIKIDEFLEFMSDT